MNSKEIKLREFILSEIQNISKNDNLKIKLKECSCGCNNCEDNNSEPYFTKIEFETVNPKEFEEESKEAKYLSEEVSRMRELLNFNNPLLNL